MDYAAKRARRCAPALGGVIALVAVLSSPAEARAADVSDGRGLAILAEGGATSPARSLAQTVYADPGLRPPALNEGDARALIGDPIPDDASREVRDLAETRAAVHGDDAPSRSLLSGLVAALHVKGIVVVESDGTKPIARVFVANAHAFDAVVYESDPSAMVTWGTEMPTVRWTGALTALHRGFAEAPTPSSTSPSTAPIVATQHGEKSGAPAGKPFYTSPWFWGALAAAAFAGAAFYFVSKGSSDPTIQLEVQVPK